MKKILALSLVLIFCLFLVACQSDQEPFSSDSSKSIQEELQEELEKIQSQAEEIQQEIQKIVEEHL